MGNPSDKSASPADMNQEVVVQQAPTNGLGTAGFIVSLLGLFLTCGVLSPVGLFFSGIALFRKPRGMAFAGAVMGGMGTAWLLVVGGLVLVGVLGGASVYQTGVAIISASGKIEHYHDEIGEYPDYMVGNKLLEGIHDGWNNRVRYHFEAGEAILTSAGPDGQFDTPDDITNQTPADGQDGGVFAQFSEALEKINEPADGEVGGLLDQALSSSPGMPNAGVDNGLPGGLPPRVDGLRVDGLRVDGLDTPEPPGGF